MLLVLDGVGDLATQETAWRTPLEAAHTPHFDALAKQSAQGRMIPVAPGITPGSGPGHLGLFGYDPLEFEVGRGVIEALGLGIVLKPGDVAARANFCTLDKNGVVTDRRAGRIPTEVCENLCARLAKIKRIGDVEIIIRPGKSHRFVVVLRGKGLEGPLSDSDPHREGQKIQKVAPATKSPKAKKAANVLNKFHGQALPLLRNDKPANGFLLRGIAHAPGIPTFDQRYGLRAASLAIYPMYKGLAQLVGMKPIPFIGDTITDQFRAYRQHREAFDYFFVHVKGTDMAGEDGDFHKKVAVIEEVDRALPVLLEQKPDVLAITGDHSTPVALKAHSWHPQPVLLHGRYSGWDGLERFTERAGNLGSLGIFEARHLIRLMMATAQMLDKFGA
jgi:2,3-bisphosphoglycerate-independent phosphoglycerate mutase